MERLSQVFLIFLVFGSFEQCSSKKQLLLWSFDGLSSWFLDADAWENLFPNITKRFGIEGCRVEVQPVFPTKTFPCHTSIVTGRHPEEHGVVGNVMVEEVAGVRRWFFLNNASEPEYRFWQDALPLWISAERAGLRTAVHSWPGGDVIYGGTRASQWYRYNFTLLPFKDRVEQSIRWLKNDHLDLVVMYHDNPDWAGHDEGPDEEIVRALEVNGLSDVVDLVVTSDHGMSRAPNVVDVWRELRVDADVRAAIEVVEDDAYLAVNVLPSATADVRERAFAALARLPNGKFYRREQIPAHLRFRAHHRIPDAIVLGEEGTYYWTKGAAKKMKGLHGYDLLNRKMRPLLMTRGPSLRSCEGKPAPLPDGATVVDQVDIYSLLAHLSGVTPAPNSGRTQLVRHLLRDPNALPDSNGAASMSAPFFGCLMLIIVALLVQ